MIASHKRKFVQNESYMHDAAKHVVASWLREVQTPQGCIQIGDVYARTSRIGGFCGVFTEYPIGMNGEGVEPCWDEQLQWSSRFLSQIYGEDLLSMPTYECLVHMGIQPKCVCDVVIIHKGAVSVAIEVVHKHPTPTWKRDFLAHHDIRLVEVRAQAVLHFTKRPEKLPLFVKRGGSA